MPKPSYKVAGEKTIGSQEHVAVAFSIKFCSDIKKLQFAPIYYAGGDAARVFVRKLRWVASNIQEGFPRSVPRREVTRR